MKIIMKMKSTVMNMIIVMNMNTLMITKKLNRIIRRRSIILMLKVHICMY